MKFFFAVVVFAVLALASKPLAQAQESSEGWTIHGVNKPQKKSVDADSQREILEVEPEAVLESGNTGYSNRDRYVAKPRPLAPDSGVRVLENGDKYFVSTGPANPKPKEFACAQEVSLKPEAQSMAASLKVISAVLVIELVLAVVGTIIVVAGS